MKVKFYVLAFAFFAHVINAQCLSPQRDCDGDAIANDLDDDNDGITDVAEGRCLGLFDAGWFSNNPAGNKNHDGYWQDPPGGPIVYGGAHDNSVVQTANFFVFGTGFSADISGSTVWTISGVNETNYTNAKTNNDYVQYSFTTPSTITPGLSFSRIGLANWNSGASYKVGVEVSTNGFATTGSTQLLTDNFPINPNGSGRYDYVYIQANDILTNVVLAPSTTYTFRVYLFGAATASTAIRYDDFQFGTCASRDTDGDGHPDYLDWDSDNDGCPDAIEGDENVLLSQLNPNGSINTASPAPNNGVGSAATTSGIPNLVNTGGSADVGSDAGQGVGSSTNASIQATECNTCVLGSSGFTDSDGDTIGNDCDLDDDNDGIPDAAEFNGQVQCLNLSSITNTNPNITTPLTITSNGTGSYSTGYTAMYSVSGTPGNPGSYTAPIGTGGGDLSLGINSTGGPANESQYMQYVITFTKPTIVRISQHTQGLGTFDSADSWRLTAAGGFSVVNTAGINIVSNSGNEIRFDPAATANQPFEIRTTKPVSSIVLKMWTNSSNNNNVSPLKVCAVLPMDTDSDGTPDYLDLDSDNDGCFDAIEGDEKVSAQQLNQNGSINITLPAPNSGVGTSTIDLGVPNLVNTGGDGDTGGDTGQGIGSSRDRTINACICYNDPNTSSAGITSQHGITLLKRAGAVNGNWPMIRNSAHTVLESNTKGLVITRMSSTQINAIVSPQEGMIVYDNVVKCLKIYSDGAWSCFSTPTCP